MTQNERLLEYLQEHGSITGLEALMKLGIIRCASRIHDLRNEGHNIRGETIRVLNRFDEKCDIKRYTLVKPESKPEDHSFVDAFMGIFGFKRAEA